MYIHCSCCSLTQPCPTLCDPMNCSTPDLTVPHYLPVCWSSCALHQWCHPAILSSDALFCSQSFPAWASNESAVQIRWSKYLSFSISPSREYSGLVPLKIDWFDLLAIQGTFRSLLQHHSLKASILYLYGPGLTTVRDHREDHSLDYMNLCWQSDVCFSTHCLGLP